MSVPMIPGLGRDAAPQDEHVPAPHLDTGAVLVVDESLPIRNKLVEILQKTGAVSGEILQASNEEEALALFRRHRPKLVFAELIGVRPEDGLEIVHAMLDHDPSTRVVLVSAEPRESAEIRAAIRAGAFAYVEKPLRHEKIRAVLADLEAEEGGIERYR